MRAATAVQIRAILASPPPWSTSAGQRVVARHHTYFAGFAGYDEFNLQQRWKNGWRVMAVDLRRCHTNEPGANRSIPTHSGADIVDWRTGTDSPSVKVRWWLDPVLLVFNSLDYKLAITVTGPKGLPFR